MNRNIRHLLAMIRKGFPFLLPALFSIGWKTGTGGTSSEWYPDRLYLYDTLLLVADGDQGIKVFSVKNTAGPREMLTIPARYNGGMAIVDSFLFTTSMGSLFVLKLHDDSLYTVEKIIAGPADAFFNDMVIDQGPVSCGCGTNVPPVAISDRGSSSPGKGGSYATFAIIDTFLYYLDKGSLVCATIGNPADPVEVSRVFVDQSIETLFPTEQHLYLGSSIGMFIYDRSDPRAPSLLGMVGHLRSCDPVVVKDSLAYVTLRSGSWCGRGVDELMIVSVANPSKPRIIKEMAVNTPYGLAVQDTMLFIGNGYYGYTVFSIGNPVAPRVLLNATTPQITDFIWQDSLLYVMTTNGFAIYNGTTPLALQLLSEVQLASRSRYLW